MSMHKRIMADLKALSKEVDTFDTLNLKPLITAMFDAIDDDLIYDGDHTLDYQNLEYQSRSGFHAHSHNRGGLDYLRIQMDQEDNSNCEGLAKRVRAMYEGNGILVLHYGIDNDAPYYRWNSKSLEIELKFKSKAELKAKLQTAALKITNYFNNL